VGVYAVDVDPWWITLEDELIPVEFDARRAWCLADDVDALRSAPKSRGVRLLPPRDPYTQMRDRAGRRGDRRNMASAQNRSQPYADNQDVPVAEPGSTDKFVVIVSR
jgi:hypothetical protein